MADKKFSDCLVIPCTANVQINLQIYCNMPEMMTDDDKTIANIYGFMMPLTSQCLNFLLHSIIVLLHQQVRH